MFPTECAYCGTTVDTALDASLVVRIARRHVAFGDDGEPNGVAVPIDVAFCGQPHLAAWSTEQTLEPVVPRPYTKSTTLLQDLGCGLSALTVVVLVIIGAIDGLVRLVQLVL